MTQDPDLIYTNKNGESEEWLRPGDVAQLLKVHPATVSRWAESGKLPCIRTPTGQRRYSATVVAELLASGEFSR